MATIMPEWQMGYGFATCHKTSLIEEIIGVRFGEFGLDMAPIAS
jgi:hypothetical protein